MFIVSLRSDEDKLEEVLNILLSLIKNEDRREYLNTVNETLAGKIVIATREVAYRQQYVLIPDSHTEKLPDERC